MTLYLNVSLFRRLTSRLKHSSFFFKKGVDLLLQALAYGDRTKKQLALALMDCLKVKSFDRISIRELTERCGIRRQSFYYHFEDIFSLLRYSLSLFGQIITDSGRETPEQSILALFHAAADHRAAYFSLTESSAAHCLEDWLRGLLQELLGQIIASEAAQLKLPEQERAEIRTPAQYYGIFLSGMLDNWLRAENPETPEGLLALVEQMLRNQLLGAHTRTEPARADAERAPTRT